MARVRLADRTPWAPLCFVEDDEIPGILRFYPIHLFRRDELIFAVRVTTLVLAKMTGRIK